MYKDLYVLKPIFLRSSNPYGSRQTDVAAQDAISTFLSNTLRQKEILLKMKKVNRTFDWSATYSIQDGLADFLKYLD